MRSIPDILKDSKTIAVVGLSNRPERASHAVAAYLQQQGYRILGVNPAYAGQQILGQPVYATLAQAAAALDGPIDIVDCFRSADAMVPLAREAIDVGARCLWMQLGVVNQEAADLAAAAGLDVVMDRCMKIEHAHSGGKA
ncbi:CoA-binding protein [Massilia pseudoviolaceinigra]|uniref:CoA-binding protein n=1 Tax=Massilia pseudoviolaceinigra TaxID=3057165 RepID=UPI00279699CF|nr:CoA-binding protein [Massilia sp. CCM 9206]MDQ1920813.1 CoA-binding protein [Massilia sp. CCM 9206]